MRNTASNYQLINIVNQYNFIISIMSIIDDDDKKDILLEQLKLHCGNKFYDNFRNYVIKKFGMKNNILNYLD